MVFPAVQECADGTADWTDISGSQDVPNPAPRLTVSAGEGERVTVHLTSDKAGEVGVPRTPGQRHAKGHDHGSMDHGSHGMKG